MLLQLDIDTVRHVTFRYGLLPPLPAKDRSQEGDNEGGTRVTDCPGGTVFQIHDAMMFIAGFVVIHDGDDGRMQRDFVMQS
jgi:hypothetical protein